MNAFELSFMNILKNDDAHPPLMSQPNENNHERISLLFFRSHKTAGGCTLTTQQYSYSCSEETNAVFLVVSV